MPHSATIEEVGEGVGKRIALNTELRTKCLPIPSNHW